MSTNYDDGHAAEDYRDAKRQPWRTAVEAGSFLGLVAVFVFFALFGGKTFLSAAGAASWLNIAAEIGIIALPIGLLMIAGELDISVGAVIPAASLTTAIVSGYWGLPDGLGIAAGIGVGLVVAFVTVVARWRAGRARAA